MSTSHPDFLTATIDLNGSVFTSQDLEAARNVFKEAFARYAPDWAKRPLGVMASLWNQQGRPAAEKLIDIAQTLFRLSKGITTESAPAFHHKVRLLLHCRSEAQFEELLAELRVGALLALRAAPVACEPLARPLGYSSAEPPPSPDFAIRLAESDVFIEVTTLRIGALDHWERAITIVRERVREAVMATGLAKEVEIHAPLRMRADALTRRLLDRLIAEMKLTADGATAIELGPVTAKIIWRQMAIVQLPLGESGPESALVDPFPSKNHFSAVIGSQDSFMAASASKVVPILGPKVEQLFIKSIRNTLDGKRAQLSIGAPSILILQPGAWRITADYVCHLIEKRIWPNPQYAWLTGIGILQPRQTFNTGDPETTLTVSWNSKPSTPRTSALNDLVGNGACFSKGVRVEH